MSNENSKRQTVKVEAPPGGWLHPWPQCLELAQSLDSSKWTLIGGLMVQLHALISGASVNRPTVDVDVVLHVETGAISAPEVMESLQALGYSLQKPFRGDSPAHRFVRDSRGVQELIDVMIADHAISKPSFMLGQSLPFAVEGGAQALRRTLICKFVDGADAKVTTISLPNVLVALVLKGAAYRADSRERERHLEDAALLSTLVEDSLILVSELRGSYRSRILSLNSALRDPMHPAWSQLELEAKERGRYALEILARNPQNLDLDRTLGPAF